VKASKRLGDVGWDRERCPPQLRGQAIIFFPREMLTDMEDSYSQFMRFPQTLKVFFANSVLQLQENPI